MAQTCICGNVMPDSAAFCAACNRGGIGWSSDLDPPDTTAGLRAERDQLRRTMSDPTDYEALGKRAVACAGWRWAEGMKTVDGWRVVEEEDSSYVMLFRPTPDGGAEWEVVHVDDAGIPDFRDPATRGCLLALVREAWGDSGLAQLAEMTPDGIRWVCFGRDGDERSPWLPTEAEALVAALEAAP